MRKEAGWLAVILILCAVAGCGRQYGGGRFGGRAIPGSVLQHCYVLRNGPVPRGPSAAANPLFLILWKATNAGSCEFDARNRLVAIHDNRISVSLKMKAVYVLQPDYTLRRIDLTQDEIEHVFNLMEQNQKHLSDDDIWRTKVEPMLERVEEKPR